VGKVGEGDTISGGGGFEIAGENKCVRRREGYQKDWGRREMGCFSWRLNGTNDDPVVGHHCQNKSLMEKGGFRNPFRAGRGSHPRSFPVLSRKLENEAIDDHDLVNPEKNQK